MLRVGDLQALLEQISGEEDGEQEESPESEGEQEKKRLVARTVEV